jgi:hypothetical protein
MTKRRSNSLGAVSPREDTRMFKSQASEVRGSRSLEDQPRENDDGAEMTPEQRRSMIRNEFQQEALPKVPEVPGWHLCWLTTTSSYDPIHKRMRLGYRPVRSEELKGFDSLRMASGEFEGCISCNEMVLFKIPMETYMAIMNEYHHIMPQEEEEALKRQLVDQTQTAVDSSGKKLGQVEPDILEELEANKKRQGVFAG